MGITQQESASTKYYSFLSEKSYFPVYGSKVEFLGCWEELQSAPNDMNNFVACVGCAFAHYDVGNSFHVEPVTIASKFVLHYLFIH